MQGFVPASARLHPCYHPHLLPLANVWTEPVEYESVRRFHEPSAWAHREKRQLRKPLTFPHQMRAGVVPGALLRAVGAKVKRAAGLIRASSFHHRKRFRLKTASPDGWKFLRFRVRSNQYVWLKGLPLKNLPRNSVSNQKTS